MRPTKISMVSLEMGESPRKVKRAEVLARPTVREPLLRFRNAELQKRKIMSEGLKDLCSDDREVSQFLQLQWVKAVDKIVPIFDPDHWVMLLWNLIVQIAILYNLFMTPIVIFFTEQVYQYETQAGKGLAINVVCLVVLYLDILAQFNTGYIDKGKLITDRALVFKIYFKFQFWIDLVSIVSITVYLAVNNYSLCYIRLVFYLRITSTIEIDQQFMQSLGITRFWLIAYRFIRMTILLWFLTSWAACVFFAIDYYFYVQQGTYYTIGQLWLTNSQATNNMDIITTFPWQIWYEYSLYWSVQTASTIGYGDLTAKNPQQIIYCNFIMLLMTVLFAYFINAVWEIIAQLQQGPVQYTNHWHNLKLYLHPLPLSRHTKERVSNYMHDLFKGNDRQEVENMIIEGVPEQLRHEFLVSTRIRFFRSHSYFNEVLNSIPDSNQIWHNLVSALEDCCIGEETIIYLQGQYDPNMYYLRSGFAKLQIKCSELGKSVQSNQIFGAQQFFARSARNHNAESVTFVQLWKLSYQNMRDCLKKDGYIYEKFCKFSDSINIQKQHSNMQVAQCWRCLNRDHFIERCPLMAYQRIDHLELVRLLLQSTTFSQRAPFHRPGRKSKRITGIKLDHERNFDADTVANFTYYYPMHNLTNFQNANRNSMSFG